MLPVSLSEPLLASFFFFYQTVEGFYPWAFFVLHLYTSNTIVQPPLLSRKIRVYGLLVRTNWFHYVDNYS